MIQSPKYIFRLLAVGCVTLAASLTPVGHSSPPADPEEAICRELQFRRLHLVRPDLIRYPLVFEVYC
jgi:hypothetical protein